MQFREYGADRREVVMLLHGGGLSWWNYREAASLLASDYHVILPILDGHAGCDRPFTSIEDNAEEILAYIDGQCGGSVLLLGGLSLGGQVLLEMLARRSDLCRFALVESAAVIPSKLTHALIAPAFGSSYGLIRNRRFAKMQLRSLRIRDDYFEEYYRDTCRIAKEDMIAFMRANTAYALKDSIRNTQAEVHVIFGERETREIRRSAEMIAQTIPACTLHRLPGMHHGEFSLNRPDAYAERIRQITGGETL